MNWIKTTDSLPNSGERVLVYWLELGDLHQGGRHFERCPATEPYVCVVCNMHEGGCGASSGYYDSEAKAIAAWNRRAQPENKPLTLDELRQMNGEPVWVCFLNSRVSVSGQWHLVRNITKEVINCFENYMPFCDYGKTWLAYRRKPEEVEHE